MKIASKISAAISLGFLLFASIIVFYFFEPDSDMATADLILAVPPFLGALAFLMLSKSLEAVHVGHAARNRSSVLSGKIMVFGGFVYLASFLGFSIYNAVTKHSAFTELLLSDEPHVIVIALALFLTIPSIPAFLLIWIGKRLQACN